MTFCNLYRNCKKLWKKSSFEAEFDLQCNIILGAKVLCTQLQMNNSAEWLMKPGRLWQSGKGMWLMWLTTSHGEFYSFLRKKNQANTRAQRKPQYETAFLLDTAYKQNQSGWLWLTSLLCSAIKLAWYKGQEPEATQSLVDRSFALQGIGPRYKSTRQILKGLTSKTAAVSSRSSKWRHGGCQLLVWSEHCMKSWCWCGWIFDGDKKRTGDVLARAPARMRGEACLRNKTMFCLGRAWQ